MEKILLIVVSLISFNTLFGLEAKDEGSIRTLPIFEVNADQMPGWEKQIIEQYGDEEGNAIPVIFRSGAKNWEAASWTPEYFAERFGDAKIVVTPPKLFEQDKTGKAMPLLAMNTIIRDHIDDITLNPKNAWYFFGDLYYNSTKENLKKDADDPLIENAIFLHTFLDLESQTRFPQSIDKSEINGKRAYNIFIGGGNTVTSLHSHDSTFLAQIYGKKLATLVDPKYKNKFSCRFKDEVDDTEVFCDIDILNPDFEKYPDIKEIQFHQTVLEAGDVLYIPKGWLHDIRGLSTSISISGGF